MKTILADLLRSRVLGVLPGLCLFLILGGTACAQYSSSNYKTSQVLFGSGGGLTNSSNYQSQQSLGSLGVGKYSSSNYQNYPGPITPETPYLQIVVNTSSLSVGTLTQSAPVTAQATFSVKTYLANSYIVQTQSPPPVNGAYTMHNLSSPTTSSIGTEQFGMNLVANNGCGGSLPANFGANPLQVPDSTYSFGTAATGYDTACNFTYNNGDVIAQSNSSSGETDYTISYLFNISSVTPGGTYTMNQSLVATSTF